MSTDSSHSCRTPLILLVDDHQPNLEVVTELLHDSFDCRVRQAVSGSDALAQLAQEPPDLVLLDVHMPGISGYDVCAAIRTMATTAEVPVIFLTGQRDAEFIVRGFDAGGTDYLLKPFDTRELVARVRVHLELKLQRDELRQRNGELEAALERIKRLEGIIPICMYCKKIRSDRSAWQDVEQYLAAHSDASFSHGVCPECFQQQCEKLKAMHRNQEE